jgi:alpha-glucosidase
MIEFAALFQLPMVGSDVCGFNGNTTVHLCARWALLGAFNPFYRNHDVQGSAPQEYYRWGNDSLVAVAARKAIATRYRLLDYLYTAMYRQHQTGAPALNPLFFMYPNDKNTFDNQLQFFYGDSILISPVLEDNTTSVTAYMPNDLFYDFWTWKPIRGKGEDMTFDEVGYTDLPMHIRGGSIVPMRTRSANTTTMLRKEGYTIIIAPGADGKATGSLYIDDGESLVQDGITDVSFSYEDGKFAMDGTFEYNAGVAIESIVVLGVKDKPSQTGGMMLYDESCGAVTHEVNVPLRNMYKMQLL